MKSIASQYRSEGFLILTLDCTYRMKRTKTRSYCTTNKRTVQAAGPASEQKETTLESTQACENEKSHKDAQFSQRASDQNHVFVVDSRMLDVV